MGVTSVLINIVIWDKHASALGIAFLLTCLVAAGAYQAAPLRTVEVSSTHLMSDKDNDTGDHEEGDTEAVSEDTPPAATVLARPLPLPLPPPGRLAGDALPSLSPPSPLPLPS